MCSKVSHTVLEMWRIIEGKIAEGENIFILLIINYTTFLMVIMMMTTAKFFFI